MRREAIDRRVNAVLSRGEEGEKVYSPYRSLSEYRCNHPDPADLSDFLALENVTIDLPMGVAKYVAVYAGLSVPTGSPGHVKYGLAVPIEALHRNVADLFEEHYHRTDRQPEYLYANSKIRPEVGAPGEGLQIASMLSVLEARNLRADRLFDWHDLVLSVDVAWVEVPCFVPMSKRRMLQWRLKRVYLVDPVLSDEPIPTV